MNDRVITVSTAGSRNSKHWMPTKMKWSELVANLKAVRRGSETHAAYMKKSRDEQSELKDVGGFVGGTIYGGRRLKGSVTARDVVSLDMDSIKVPTKEVLGRVEALRVAACVYSTRKHEPENPRLRIIIGLSESVTPDQYQPISRKLAEMIGIEMCDPTTFEIHRLMYWPSASADSEFVYKYYDYPLCDPESILAMYGGNEAWKDVVRWPTVPGTAAKMESAGNKKGDPCEKPGIVGAWNRVHDVYDALENVLQGRYLPTDDPTRWTYCDGSTHGGAIVHDDGKFLYSYHSTDPTMGTLVNSWELCRIHLFGAQDKDAIIDPRHPDRSPSGKAMKDFAAKDAAVMDDLARRDLESATADFSAASDSSDGVKPVEKIVDVEWMRELKRDENGNLKTVQENFIHILRNDPNLQGIGYNTMTYSIQVKPDFNPPWKRTSSLSWTDTDDASCRNYIAMVYHISGKDKVSDAIMGVAVENSFDPIIEKFESLPEWDNEPRLDSILIDYLGAEDSEYTRSVTAKTFMAAVARQYHPGKKFDTVLTLVGPQGVGKSTFFSTFGMEWFADGLTLTDMRDKSGAEKLQGRMIMEMGELVGMRKAEEESIKSFLSCKDDWYRSAFGKTAISHPRRCIVVATTNAESGFLRDITGNRRFWPVPITGEGWLGTVHDINQNIIDLVWAEAKARYLAGETLYIDDDEVQAQAVAAQREATEVDERAGFVRLYLDRLLPENWEDMSINERKSWLNNDFGENKGTVRREYVSAIEVWVECFGRDKSDMKRSDSVDINRILSSFVEWDRNGPGTKSLGPYGVQRVFTRNDIVSISTGQRAQKSGFVVGLKH